MLDEHIKTVITDIGTINGHSIIVDQEPEWASIRCEHCSFWLYAVDGYYKHKIAHVAVQPCSGRWNSYTQPTTEFLESIGLREIRRDAVDVTCRKA